MAFKNLDWHQDPAGRLIKNSNAGQIDNSAAAIQ
jgi:hypothetical protein